MATGKWGDAVPGFGGGTQPDFGDITAVVDKFKERLFAPDMTRVDLRGGGSPGAPDTPDQTADFSDVGADVDAFKGTPYPFTVPACP